MGTKYASVAVSGYNATPPSDDGTISEANKVKWSTIKTKLTDPHNTAVASIDSKLVSHFDRGPVAVVTNTTLGATHYAQMIQASGVGVTLTLTDAATLTAGWFCEIVSTDETNSVTLARATAADLINETTADITILPMQQLRVMVNAAANGFLVKNGWRHSKATQIGEAITFIADQTFQSSDAGATQGPTVILDRNSASPAVSDVLGLIEFRGRDSGGANEIYTQIYTQIQDPTDTSEDARLVFQSVIAGTVADRVFIGHGLYTGGGSDQGADTIQGFSGVFDGANRVYSAGNLPVATIAQGALKTAQSSVSTTTDKTLLTLPGGEYGFYPQVRSSITGSELVTATIGGVIDTVTPSVSLFTRTEWGTTFLTRIALGTQGTGSVLAQQRHVSASPPYEPYRIGDVVPIFVFIVIDKTTKTVLSTYVSEDAPWINNGPTLLSLDGRLQALAKVRVSLAGTPAEQFEAWADFDLWMEDPINQPTIAAEIARKFTQKEKNRDMALIPHPFGNYDPARQQVLVLSPTDCRFCRGMRARHRYSGDSISEMLHSGQIIFNADPISGLATPTGVMAVHARPKLTR